MGEHLLMRPGSSRGLTLAERALAAEVFGQAVDLGPVRIWASVLPLVRTFVAGRWFGRDWIIWPAREALLDFAAPAVPVRTQGVLVHELVHVQQAQAGVNLLFAKLKAGDSAAAYDYGVDEARAWTAMNIEQQAMLVEHAFLRSRGYLTPWKAEAYAAALPFRPPAPGDDLEQA
jgi:hypothetical protein